IGFVFARGSMEPSPMGMLIGPQLESDLKKAFPKTLTTYPVLYSASLLTNLSPARTDQASIDKGLEAFRKAASCRIIIAAGYSQGAAVMHNVVSWKGLDSALKNKIAGVALFGDTRNQQDKGHILNFPAERSKVWCTPSDGVCGGQLNVNAAHLSYSNGI
ncbi:alpha/beta-hydrolase, partial [Trichodelitschia bisporula]